MRSKRLVLEQRSQQLARAAAEIEHAPRAARPQRRDDGAHPLLVQAQRLLDGFLLGRARLLVLVLGRILFREQLLDRGALQGALVLEVARHDQLAVRVAGEPALPAGKQLLDLVVADPVVLLRVEHRHEHVEVRQQVAQPALAGEPERVVAARAPLRETLVERVVDRLDDVAERLEQLARDLLAAHDRRDREARLERQRLVGEAGARVAAPAHRRRERAREGDAQERRGDVRPVVHVLVDPPEADAAADQPDRVDVEQQRRRATLLRRLRVEDVRGAERQLAALHALRVLMEQEPEIGRGRAGEGDGQQHLGTKKGDPPGRPRLDPLPDESEG
jgi:hypothetical protein